MKTVIIFFILLFVFLISGCDGIICEGEKKSVVLSYNPEFKTIDIGGSPTYKANDSWVKKIFVSDIGFLVLTSQKTVKMIEKENCNKQKENCLEHTIEARYNLQTYKEQEGYKYWFNLTEQERQSLSDINSRLSRNPDFYAPKCREAPAGGLLDFIMTVDRA
ncbi:MAG: hypothetical protein OXC37_04440 [Bdellovibrionaceae bacterium]|nr:hypothetical protein [Pseudobdellovibrionaceae bacterium]